MSEFEMGAETAFRDTDTAYGKVLSNGFATSQNAALANAVQANSAQNVNSLMTRLSGLSEKHGEKIMEKFNATYTSNDQTKALMNQDMADGLAAGGHQGDGQIEDHVEGLVESVFETLARSEDDVVGLLAYSLYKQNKRDWITSFMRVNRRTPSEQEVQSFLIGETMARRLATYRHLAEITLLDGLPVRLQPSSNQSGMKSVFTKKHIGRILMIGAACLVIGGLTAKWYYGLSFQELLTMLTGGLY